MTETPPPPDHPDPHGALIDRGGSLARWHIDEITALLALEPRKNFGAAFLRWIRRHFLLPAQSIQRRADYLIAATLPPLAPPDPKSGTPARATTRKHLNRKTAAAWPPLSRLTEP